MNTRGRTGATGETGQTGKTGAKGGPGRTGASGADARGERGRTGLTGPRGLAGPAPKIVAYIAIGLTFTLILVVAGLYTDSKNTKKQNERIEQELETQRAITDQLEGVGHVGPCRAALKEQVVKLPKHPSREQKRSAVTKAIRDPECQQQSRLLFLSFCDQFPSGPCQQLLSTAHKAAEQSGVHAFGSSDLHGSPLDVPGVPDAPRRPVSPPKPHPSSPSPSHPNPSPGPVSTPSKPTPKPPALIPDLNQIIDTAQQQINDLTKTVLPPS